MTSSLRLDTVNPRIGPSQPKSEFIGLRVVNEPKEEEDTIDLRVGLMERHHKRLYETINIVPLPAKKACPEKTQEDPTGEELLHRPCLIRTQRDLAQRL